MKEEEIWKVQLLNVVEMIGDLVGGLVGALVGDLMVGDLAVGDLVGDLVVGDTVVGDLVGGKELAWSGKGTQRPSLVYASGHSQLVWRSIQELSGHQCGAMTVGT